MISEFVGPPGSGKSASAQSLAGHYGGLVVKLNGFAFGASIGRVGPILAQPSLMAAGSILDWRLAINLCRRNKLMSRLPTGRIWIEDGPLFALSRMVAEDVPQQWIVRVIRRMHLPDQCVVVNASAATCLYRLKHLRHGQNRLARLEPSRAIQILDDLNRATDRVVACLPAGVAVIRLENDENTDGTLMNHGVNV